MEMEEKQKGIMIELEEIDMNEKKHINGLKIGFLNSLS